MDQSESYIIPIREPTGEEVREDAQDECGAEELESPNEGRGAPQRKTAYRHISMGRNSEELWIR